MKTNEANKKFSMEEVITIGQKLAAANKIFAYAPGSHYCLYSLFPQTKAQYNWLKKRTDTTANVIIDATIGEVLEICPELDGYVMRTKNGKSCRIDIQIKRYTK